MVKAAAYGQKGLIDQFDNQRGKKPSNVPKPSAYGAKEEGSLFGGLLFLRIAGSSCQLCKKRVNSASGVDFAGCRAQNEVIEYPCFGAEVADKAVMLRAKRVVK
jgi:hypothetical protein